MSREIYGNPRPRGPITTSEPSPVLTYMNKATSILTDLTSAGAKGKKTAVERMAVVEQMLRISVTAAKKQK
jgi:hypothetical protein